MVGTVALHAELSIIFERRYDLPALDHCEPQVLRALYKQGWHVVDKPLPLRVEQGQRYLFADARLQNINTQEAVIIIEIKCFANLRTLMDDLYSAIGQYLVYLNGLELNNVKDSLFLTMPHQNMYSFSKINSSVSP